MVMDYKEELESGIFHGFIDGNTVALEAYKPRLLINDIEQGEKVLSSIIIEMQKWYFCNAIANASFYFSN
jgi:HKD family nuclease